MGSIINKIFYFIAEILVILSQKFNITYNEINILTYYIFIPLIWAIILDISIEFPLFSPILIIFYIIISLCIKDFSLFCDNLFYKSQKFIMFFGDYVIWSVIICVIIPIIITALLIWV